ncbi:Glycerol kinase [Aphelenchoides besseyi]|nr:Glycerol kinase [Aphelenchoides besseyi]
MVLLGAIDQGTSSSRFLIFESDSGELVTSHQIEVEQLYPAPGREKDVDEDDDDLFVKGWVEMSGLRILETVIECISVACSNLERMGIPKDEIKSIGLANQRETTIVWSKKTGKPLHNAIVWLDTRTSDLADEMTNKTPTRSKDHFKQKTGLPIHPYFSALKLKWLLENVPEVQEALDDGDLMFGTVDTWLIYNLTGAHVTDVSNASRTLLLDLHKRKWSTELCNFFGIPHSIMPAIRSSAEIYGFLKHGELKGVPISGCVGDQQAALIGHNCLRVGDAKSTYGTGTFMLCNTGVNPIISKNGLLTTVGFQFGAHAPVCYALEGSGSIGGNVVRFLRDNLKFIKKSNEVEGLAGSVEDTGDVVFVPAFTGLYSPTWDSTARGTICGLTMSTSTAHIARAALQAVAFQASDMIEAVERDLDHPIQALKTDGGMTANKLFMQMNADVFGRPVTCSLMPEISGWGAAVAGGIGAHQLSLAEFAQHTTQKQIRYTPVISEQRRVHETAKWKEALQRSRNWSHAL